MTPELEQCLDALERAIQPEIEDRLYAEWKAFSDGDFDGDLFEPSRSGLEPPAVAPLAVNINDALEDYDAMLLQQYGACLATLAAGGGTFMAIRANYGSSILPLVFGVETFVMDREMNTLPTSRPLADGIDGVRRLVDAGVPDLDTGYGERVCETGRQMMEIRARYPKIGRYVHIYHPDLQGPMDVCEVIWGSSLFLDIVDEPDLVKQFLDVICETYTAFLRRWETIVPFDDGYNIHWGLLHKGRIMLRDDSAMNFSPEMFEEFVEPYDQRLLDAFGGGGIHFCGRGSHYIHRFPEMRGVHAVPMSQPECNDMERIFQYTVDRGIKLVAFNRQAADAALAAGRDLQGNVQVGPVG